MRERNELEDRLGSIDRFERELDDAITLVELGESENDADTEKEGVAALKALVAEARRRQVEALFAGEADGNDTYIEVHSGAGGTESQDWARMLFRMYARWAERHKFKVEIIEETQGRRYFSALCRVLEDDAEAPDEALAQEAVRRFQEFSERLTGERRDPPEIDGVPLSYAITGAMEMPTPIKQRILSLRNEPARLTSVIRAIDIAQRSTDRIELAAKRAKTNGKVSHP